jgi:hypothetical protein
VPANKAREVFARSTERREVRSLVVDEEEEEEEEEEEDLTSPVLEGLARSGGTEYPCFLLLLLLLLLVLPPLLTEEVKVGLGGDGESTVKLSPFNSSSPSPPLPPSSSSSSSSLKD